MSGVSRYFFVHSNYRSEGGATDCTIPITPALHLDTKGLRLVEICFPNTVKNIHATNQVLLMNEAGFGDFSVTIPTGIYNATLLGAIIGTTISAASLSGSTYTLTYIPEQVGFAWTTTGGVYTVRLLDTRTLYPRNNLYTILGITSTDGRTPINALSSSYAGGVIRSNTIANILSTPLGVYCTVTMNNHIMHNIQGLSTGRSITFTFPLASDSGAITSYTYGDIATIIRSPQPVVHTMHFRFSDDQDTVIDNGMAPWYCCFELVA